VAVLLVVLVGCTSSNAPY